MVNRNVSLYSMLLDMWARDLNVKDTLHYCTIMGFSRCVVEPQIKPVFARLDSEYNAVMQKHNDEDYCRAHGDLLGEGDICASCEARGDAMVSALNVAMAEKPYELWFVLSKQHLYRCPVKDFDQAKMLFHALNPYSTTGVRIARMCDVEGCEVVLHKFI